MSDYSPPPPVPGEKPSDFSAPSAVATADYSPPPGVAVSEKPAAIDFSTLKPETVHSANQLATIAVLTGKAIGQSPDVVQAMAKFDPSWLENWKGGVDAMAKQREIDALSYLQALGDRTPQTTEKIKVLQAEQAKDPRANLLQQIISGAGEQGAAGLRGAGMWLLGAITWPYRKAAEAIGIQTADQQAQALARVGANFGLSPERTAALTGPPIQALGESLKEITAGVTGPTYRALVDEKVDPDVAAAASFAIGGALSALQLVPAGRLIPGAQRLGEESFKRAVVALAQNGGILALAKLWGSRVAVIGAEQAAIGMANATTNVLGQEWARQYSNATTGTAIPPTSFVDLAKDILVQGATQAIVGTAIGGITAARELRPTWEMGNRLAGIVDDMRAARARNVTEAEAPPAGQKALPLPDARAPVEEARALLTATPEQRTTIPETQAKLDEVVNAIAENPTPATVPQALEAAKASDALAASPEVSAPEQVNFPLTDLQVAMDARESAIQMADNGDAIDATEFAHQMKLDELPGQEHPIAWYEDQWNKREQQRAIVEGAKDDQFLSSLTHEELKTTLREIANNPDAVVAKDLQPMVGKELSKEDFQAFVVKAAKQPAKWRRAIEQALDPEARQGLQNRIAEGAASKVTRAATSDALVKKYSDWRVGELTTADAPEKVQAAAVVAKLLKAASKPPSSAIAYDSRVKIEDMQNAVSLNAGPKVRQLRDRLRAYYQEHPETPPDAATRRLLDEKLIPDMKVKDVVDLAEAVDKERLIGKTQQAIKRAKEQKFIEDFKNRLMNDVQMGRGWKKNLEEPVIPPKGMEAFQKVKGAGSKQAARALKGNIWQRQAANTLSPQRIFRYLGPAGERAWDMINEARSNEWRANDALLEPAVKKSKEIGVAPRMLARRISTGGLDFTVDDVLAMRWAYEDENSRETLLYGNNITQEQYDELVGKLTAKDKLWGDYMQSVFGPENYKRLAQAYVDEMNAAPPPAVERYFPIRIQDRQYDSPGSEIAEDLGARGGVRSAKPNKRFMTPRRDIAPEHRQRMRLGATSLFFEQIAKQEHYINTWQTAKQLKKVFMTDPKVREQIAQMFGNDWNKAIASAINAFANPNALKATLPGDAFANTMRHALTSSGLVGNLVTIGYNLTGPLGYLGDAGPRYLLSGLAQWTLHPKQVLEEVWANVPLIKHASIDPVIQGLKNVAPNEYRSLMQLVEKVGYQPLEQVDMWTRVVGAKAVHDKAIDAGLSEKEAWNEALLATQRSQPSGDPADLPMIYNAASLKIFLAFSRQLNQIWNMASADVPLDIAQGNFLRALGTITSIALTGLFIGMMGAKDLPKDPKEAALWMLDQFVVSIPLVGNQLEPLLIGKGYHTGAEIIPGFSKMAGDVKALATGRNWVDSTIKVLIDMTRFVGGPAVMLSRLYGTLHTGDPWELIGGKPR